MNLYKALLKQFNITDEEYKFMTRDLSLSSLEDYHNFDNVDKAKERILKAINQNEKIMIYGDYDCDGITSVSILVKMFKYLNYDNVGYYIPSRYKDGYGINSNMVELIASKGYSVIITVDNGVSQIEALNLAKDKGIDVILTDHHEILNDLPPYYTILHPCFKNKEKLAQCGGYVAFMLASAVLGRYDEYLMCLAGLATISDLMPLVKQNRDIVRLTIMALNKYNYRQFALLKNSDGEYDEKTLGFDIAPKINAVGRIKKDNSPNKIIKFFISDDTQEIIKISNFINSVNTLRKNLSTDAIETLDLSLYENDKVIVTRIDDLSEGLVGLVAARITSTLKKPSVVLCKADSGILKGSARSLDGFDVAEAFKSVEDLLIVYGGHAKAGGCSLNEENFEEFKRRLNLFSLDKDIKPEEKKSIEVSFEDLSYENYELIKSFSPFGEGFKEVYLKVPYDTSKMSLVGREGKHVKGIINDKCSFIHFNVNKELLKEKEVHLIGSLEKDNYLKNKNVTFKVEEIIK